MACWPGGSFFSRVKNDPLFTGYTLVKGVTSNPLYVISGCRTSDVIWARLCIQSLGQLTLTQSNSLKPWTPKPTASAPWKCALCNPPTATGPDVSSQILFIFWCGPGNKGIHFSYVYVWCISA